MPQSSARISPFGRHGLGEAGDDFFKASCGAKPPVNFLSPGCVTLSVTLPVGASSAFTVAGVGALAPAATAAPSGCVSSGLAATAGGPSFFGASSFAAGPTVSTSMPITNFRALSLHSAIYISLTSLLVKSPGIDSMVLPMAVIRSLILSAVLSNHISCVVKAAVTLMSRPNQVLRFFLPLVGV